MRRQGRISRPATVTLDAPYLTSFGELRVPRHLWQALQRLDVWIEPALIAEWSRLMVGYGQRQGRLIDSGTIAAAMRDMGQRLHSEAAIHWLGDALPARLPCYESPGTDF